MPENETETYERVARVTGWRAQADKMAEECDECKRAHARMMAAPEGKFRDRLADFAEEVADVLIVAEVLRHTALGAAIDSAIRYKTARMKKFFDSGCKTWAEYKSQNYPGFAIKKSTLYDNLVEDLRGAGI